MITPRVSIIKNVYCEGYGDEENICLAIDDLTGKTIGVRCVHYKRGNNKKYFCTKGKEEGLVRRPCLQAKLDFHRVVRG